MNYMLLAGCCAVFFCLFAGSLSLSLSLNHAPQHAIATNKRKTNSKSRCVASEHENIREKPPIAAANIKRSAAKHKRSILRIYIIVV